MKPETSRISGASNSASRSWICPTAPTISPIWARARARQILPIAFVSGNPDEVASPTASSLASRARKVAAVFVYTSPNCERERNRGSVVLAATERERIVDVAQSPIEVAETPFVGPREGRQS